MEAGTVKLVGADETKIVNSVMELLHDKKAYERMANAVNPYGDGWAAERSVQAIANLFGLAKRPPEFSGDRSESHRVATTA
jgi:UDP-N-acetylglucosamine 2-epimerase (non-hydrolysing)